MANRDRSISRLFSQSGPSLFCESACVMIGRIFFFFLNYDWENNTQVCCFMAVEGIGRALCHIWHTTFYDFDWQGHSLYSAGLHHKILTKHYIEEHPNFHP